MNNKIIIGSVIVIVIVVAGVGIYNLTFKKPSMNTDDSQKTSQEKVEKLPLTELVANDLVVGTGAEAVAGDEITVHYTGKLVNDIIFDSSYNRNEPFIFTLGVGMVIQGWDQGMVGMKVGGKRTLAIPATMAYGANPRGSIPANSDLYFEVDLLSIKGK